MILDNCGLELIHDLLAASLLLDLNLAGSVVLHAKFHPTFVSDAVLLDIHVTIEFLCVSDDPCICRAGELLQAKIDSGMLWLQDDPYWNSPLAFWHVPDRVIQDLGESSLVISKGDANYRRFLGDRHWPYDFPAQAAFGYLPFPFLGLRVCKSEVMVGLRADQVESMNSTDPGWMVNGRWGVVQFVDSRVRREL